MEVLKQIFIDSWDLIKAHPLAFVCVFLVGYSIAAWYYDGRLKTMQGRLAAKDDDIKRKNEQLKEAARAGVKAARNPDKRQMMELALEILEQAEEMSRQTSVPVGLSNKLRAMARHLLQESFPKIEIALGGFTLNAAGLEIKLADLLRKLLDSVESKPQVNAEDAAEIGATLLISASALPDSPAT
jgi:hypothetical protein